jgi:aldose 1-epimerase
MRSLSHRILLRGTLVLCVLTLGCTSEPGNSGTETSSTQPAATQTPDAEKEPVMQVSAQQEPYGAMPDGTPIQQYLLSNTSGLSVSIINYGAIVTSVYAPDKDGQTADVTLGFDDLDGWLMNGPYFGAIVGRFANRIAAGKFSIDGQEYSVATNNDGNHLHGGIKGFDKVVWTAELLEPTPTEASVVLRYTSPDGEEGYPGTLSAEVKYTLTADNELKIEYQATADKKTIVNLTNHCYWNLAGAGSGQILDHELTLTCGKYLPVEAFIPTGVLADVAGTPMDFTTPHTIGERIADVDGGYDHCYVIDGAPGKLRPVAKVKDSKSGRVMEISSDQLGVQLYSGNFLNGEPNNGGFTQHQGFCLETQTFPDAPNQPSFPSAVLEPGNVYKHVTVHQFSVEK